MVFVEASQLHALLRPDMISLCKQAKIMTPVLKRALEAALSKCTSCKTTGRPLISFDKLLRTFNDHVQVDFLFIRELGKEPILSAREKASRYAATVSLPNTDMDIVANSFVILWVYAHGFPKIVSVEVRSTGATINVSNNL